MSAAPGFGTGSLPRLSGDRVGGAIIPGSQCRSYTNSLPRWLTALTEANLVEAPAPKPPAFASFWRRPPTALRTRRPRSGDWHRARFGAADAVDAGLCALDARRERSDASLTSSSTPVLGLRRRRSLGCVHRVLSVTMVTCGCRAATPPSPRPIDLGSRIAIDR